MPTTYFQDNIACGPTPSQSTPIGFVPLVQRVALTSNSSTAASATIVLPANSQIVNFFVDKTVDRVGGTATTLPVTVGTAAAGTQYMTSVDMFAAGTGRAVQSPTVAQVLAKSNIGTNTSVVVTVAPNGTITTTQAQILLTVFYTPPLT
jgi:hypothetical protein